ncbi:cyclodeaminase/cyclohydrolase family protein [Microbacterium sp. P05]|uniref:cyclodeaminase/cyclohydrolase family protein n=1 Tax=Microbacterium sp. P05 TaxID=3366948 RepID=UPI0037477BD8
MPADSDIPLSLGLDAWLVRLSEAHGAPGGGSAAGVMLGLSAALLHMVSAYTPENAEAQASGERLAALRERSLEAGRADGIASVALGEALASHGPERGGRVRARAIAGARSSARLGAIGIALSHELTVIAAVGNLHVVADTGIAAEALRAALGAALINLRSNLALARKHSSFHDASDDIDELTVEADRLQASRSSVEQLLATLPLE